MIFLVGVHQLTMSDMGVNLGRSDICVTQHHLDGAKVGTAFE